MATTVKIQFKGEQLEEALGLPDDQTVAEFLQHYRNDKASVLNIALDTELDLYQIPINARKAICLASDATFRSLPIQQNSILELRERSPQTQDTVTSPDDVPTQVFPSSQGYVSPIPGPPYKPVNPRLHCSLAIGKSKLIRIPHSGLVIDRALITQHLSLAERARFRMSKIAFQESPLEYVSRKPHCEVYLNTATQQWELKAYRAITIQAQVYEKGRLFQLPAHITVVQLGRAGMLISFHVTLE